MITFFIGSLVFSCTGIVLLLTLKRYEMTTGRVMGSGLRPRVSNFFHMISLWIERILPTLVRMYSKILTRAFLSSVHKVTALAVVRVEHTLERTLHTLRHTTDVRRGMSEASVFLREVSETVDRLRASYDPQPRELSLVEAG